MIEPVRWKNYKHRDECLKRFFTLMWFYVATMMFSSSPAQVIFDPRQSMFHPRVSAIGFQQDFNNYLWQYDFHLLQSISPKWQIIGTERFRSSLLKVGSATKDKWKDDQTLNVILKYQALPQLSLFSTASYILFMDQQSGYQSNIRTKFAGAGIEFFPQTNIRSKAQIGPKWDTRYGHGDNGVHYTINVCADDLDLEGYKSNLNFILDQDQFRIRQNRNLNVNYAVTRYFGNDTSDSLRVIMGNQRRDNYLSTQGDIESFRESVKGLDNLLIYGYAPWMSIRLDSRVLFKNVQVLYIADQTEQRRRKRNDQLISNILTSIFNSGTVHGRISLLYENQHQRYDISKDKTSSPFSRRTAFVTPDNKSSTIALTGRVTSQFYAVDTLAGYFSISKFQYDTPDTNNFDDRDELRINTSLTAQRALGPFLKLKLIASVNLYHMVYIFGERSADNNWNRIFRLHANMNYHPNRRINLKQSFEVLANYVDYDFEQSSPNVRSFVFRKFAADDSLRLQLTSHISLDVNYRLQLDEHGRLFWDKWSEQVLVSRENHWLRVSLRYIITPQIWFAPGYTLYRRDEWRHRTDPFGVAYKKRSGKFISQGPVMRLLYAPSSRTRLQFSAIRLAVDAPSQRRYYINNIEMQVLWYF